MKLRRILVPCAVAAGLVLLSHCAEDPADNAEPAGVVDEAAADAAAMELANSLDFGFGEEEEARAGADEAAGQDGSQGQEPRIFVFEKASRINFVGSKPTAIHKGTFANFAGHFTVLGDQLDDEGTHRISIDMSSVTTDDEKLTTHLKSGDFFDVANFPVATFSLSGAVPTGGAVGEIGYDLSGVLDLHGVRKKITFPATVAVAEDRASLSLNAKFSIDRKAFGIVYPGLPDDLIRDRVVIELVLKAVPGDPAPLQMTSTEQRSQPMVLSAPDNAGEPRPGGGGGDGQRRFGGGPGGGRGGARGGTPAEMIARMDSNGDGKLSQDEAPGFMWDRISPADTDGDGAISEEEFAALRAQREAEGGAGAGGFGRRPGGGERGSGFGGGGDRGGNRGDGGRNSGGSGDDSGNGDR